MSETVNLAYGHRAKSTEAAIKLALEPGEIGLNTADNSLWMRDYSGNSFQLNPTFDINRLGADPTGVADSTDVFEDACAAIQAKGRGNLVMDGTYRIATLANSGVLGNFTSCQGIRIIGNGSVINIDRTFTGTQTASLFKFTACKAIQILDYEITSPEESAGTRDTRGIIAHTFLQGCIGIYVRGIKQTGGVEGLFFSREYTDPESYRSKNIVVDGYETHSVGYSFMFRHSGDNFRGSLDAYTPHRAWFMYGVSNVEINSRVQDQDSDCIIKGYNGAANRNIRINYVNKNSTAASIAAGDIEIKGNQDGATHSVFEDIDIRMDVDYTGQATYTGPVFLVGNNNSADTGNDTADRGHIFERIRLTGAIKGSSSLVPFAVCTTGSWGSGNYIRAFSVSDMSVYGTGSGSFVLSSLQDKATFTNFVSDAQMFISGNTTGIITCLGCKAVNLTASTVDTSYMDFFGCQITSGTTISKINKNFLPYHVGATYEQMALYRTVAGSSVIARMNNKGTTAGSNAVFEVDTESGGGSPVLAVSINGGNTFGMAVNQADGKMVFMKGLDPASNKIIAVDPTTLEVQIQNDISISNSHSVNWAPGPKDFAGSGTPEGVVTAPIGSTYRRSNGGAGTSFYVKESGSGNTGWVAK